MIVSKRILVNSLILSVIYFAVCLTIGGINNSISSIIMSVNLLLVCTFVYDRKLPLFSAYNFFVCLFFLFGIFFRFVLMVYPNSIIMRVAYIPHQNLPDLHIFTSIIIFLAIIFWVLGKLLYDKTNSFKEFTSSKNHWEFGNRFCWVQLLAVFVYACVFLYQLNNVRVATKIDYGTYDNIVRWVSIFPTYIAYYSFVRYLKAKRHKDLVVFLLIVLPSVIVAILSAWKGAALFLILNVFCVVGMVYKYRRSSVLKMCSIMLVVFVFVFPFISVYRHVLQAGGILQDVTLDQVLCFGLENNVFVYLSGRFSVYDYIYHVVNLDEHIIDSFNNVSGLLHEEFFATIVPRILYPDKPPNLTGLHITHYLMQHPDSLYNNLSISYIGKAWVSYGIAGVVVLSALFSYGFCKIEQLRYGDIGKKALYALLGINFCMSLVEGGLVEMLLRIIVVCIFVKILFAVFGRKTLLACGSEGCK